MSDPSGSANAKQRLRRAAAIGAVAGGVASVGLILILLRVVGTPPAFVPKAIAVALLVAGFGAFTAVLIAQAKRS
jgi:hypothetical protein